MKKRTIILGNKVNYTLLTIILLLFLGVFAYAQYNTPIPSPGHGATQVLVNINGQDYTLQQAIDQGLFNSSSPTITDSSRLTTLGTCCPQTSIQTLFTYSQCSQITQGWNTIELSSIPALATLSTQELNDIEAVIIRADCGEARMWFSGKSSVPGSTENADRICNYGNNLGGQNDVIIGVTSPATGGATSPKLHFKIEGTDCSSITAEAHLVGYYSQVN